MNKYNDFVGSVEAMLKWNSDNSSQPKVFDKYEVRPQKYDFSEMDMVETWCEILKVEYVRKSLFDGEQILFFKNGKRVADVVLHCGSYGCEEGLLEGYGDGFGDEIDEVSGYMTANDVIMALTKMYWGN